MISIERSIPVNPDGASVQLSRSDVWRGLVLKANNALKFVPLITYCEVLSREGDRSFVREIELKGERLRERVTLDAERKVTFERLDGSVLGTIENAIDEGADGALSLRFSFKLSPQSIAPDSGEERAYAASMESAYLGAVEMTLSAIRKMAQQG